MTWTSTHHDYLKAVAPIYVWQDILNCSFSEWIDTSRTNISDTSTFHRAEEYWLPADIADHTHAVFNTVQPPPKVISKLAPPIPLDRSTSHLRSEKTSQSGAAYVSVSFLNRIYGISSNVGSSQLSQGVFETNNENYSPNDLTYFQRYFNLPYETVIDRYGLATTSCSFGNCGEGNLDVQYLTSVAQNTPTIYWYADASTNDPFINWILDVSSSSNPPQSNSISWGSVEQV